MSLSIVNTFLKITKRSEEGIDILKKIISSATDIPLKSHFANALTKVDGIVYFNKIKVGDAIYFLKSGRITEFLSKALPSVKVTNEVKNLFLLSSRLYPEFLVETSKASAKKLIKLFGDIPYKQVLKDVASGVSEKLSNFFKNLFTKHKLLKIGTVVSVTALITYFENYRNELNGCIRYSISKDGTTKSICKITRATCGNIFGDYKYIDECGPTTLPPRINNITNPCGGGTTSNGYCDENCKNDDSTNPQVLIVCNQLTFFEAVAHKLAMVGVSISSFLGETSEEIGDVVSTSLKFTNIVIIFAAIVCTVVMGLFVAKKFKDFQSSANDRQPIIMTKEL